MVTYLRTADEHYHCHLHTSIQLWETRRPIHIITIWSTFQGTYCALTNEYYTRNRTTGLVNSILGHGEGWLKELLSPFKVLLHVKYDRPSPGNNAMPQFFAKHTVEYQIARPRDVQRNQTPPYSHVSNLYGSACQFGVFNARSSSVGGI